MSVVIGVVGAFVAGVIAGATVLYAFIQKQLKSAEADAAAVAKSATSAVSAVKSKL